MAKVSFVDKMIALKVSADLKDALEGFYEDDGLDIAVGEPRWNDREVTVRVKVTIADQSEYLDAKKAEWDAHCEYFGFSSEDFGRKFQFGAKMYTICGIKPRNYKLPIIAKDVRGKLYKWSPSHIKEKLI